MLLESQQGLSRRERQIMDILYQRGKSSASEVREAMENRAQLFGGARNAAGARRKRAREAPGGGLRYVYVPTVTRDKAKRSAVKHLLDTFFRNSPEQVVAALLDVSSTRLTREELDRMAAMIEQAKREGK